MKTKLYSTEEKKQTAFLVSISVNKEFNPEESQLELKALAEAGGFEVLGGITQSTNQPSVQYLIGTGKLEELKGLVDKNKPDVIIFDNELSGMRMRNLEEYLDCKVVDRSMLILDIFASRAVSSEGKLQVELAQLKYSTPRIMGLRESNNKYGGGVGMRGPGETQLELDRRKIALQIEKIKKKLAELDKHRDVLRQNREKNKAKKIAIVGYTNSGKSTLLNTLTKAGILAKDMLFATLDTTSRSLWFEQGKSAVITDTVGFVSRLPHEFIEAFKSTLKETALADLLIIVVDGSSKKAERELEIVFEVLKSIGANDKPYIVAINKIDKGIVMSDCAKQSAEVIHISAKHGTGIDKLKEAIIKKLF